MKLILAGTTWLLFSGLISLPAPSVPVQPPQISIPDLKPIMESTHPEKSQASSFLSQLEEDWQTGHLLAVSA